MTQRTTFRHASNLRIISALSLAILLGVALPTYLSNVKAQTPAGSTASSQRRGQNEGIKVHGYWIIEVRNPDGTLVTHREFENGLYGATDLSMIMSRKRTPGLWQINVGGNPNPCAASKCTLSEPNYDVSQFSTTRNVIVGVGPELKGSFTATADGNISEVFTFLSTCAPDISTAACAATGIMTDTVTMTGTTLATPIHVDLDQIVQVKVTISFQSPSS